MASTTISQVSEVKDILTLVDIKLDEKNYNSWKFMISPLIGLLEGWGHIEGSHPCPPTDDPEYKNWVKKDLLITLSINSTISPSILLLLPSAIGYSPSSYTLWNMLKEVCSPPQADPLNLLMLEAPMTDVESTDAEGMGYVRQYYNTRLTPTTERPKGLKGKVMAYMERVGWVISSVDLKRKKELRYESPDKKRKFSSLVKACEYIIDPETEIRPPMKKRKSVSQEPEHEEVPAAAIPTSQPDEEEINLAAI